MKTEELNGPNACEKERKTPCKQLFARCKFLSVDNC